ncbi:lysozyme inhibitor LprI family protein [Duganella sp. FT27W]|uniref:lysozyme inhibitor LprI family protein n=1 Tax=Duganella sp. FT27W TaxID=2654636 RepID=UPI00128D5370|nr:lysozyme inhibitor LprI family protein [Duganella sp. FT27W]MPQ55342.1 DUF1311 domain-containing protein [Duganella sp. FT27W]
MPKPLLTLVLTMALGLGGASAQALDCANAASTPDMNECAARTQKAAEANLNATYSRVLKTVTERKVRTQFVAAQRLWIKYREADCKTVQALYGTGTIRTVMYLGCLQNRAETRTRELDMLQGDR